MRFKLGTTKMLPMLRKTQFWLYNIIQFSDNVLVKEMIGISYS